MVKCLELVLRIGHSEYEFRVSRKTHLGRFNRSQGWIIPERECPINFEDLELSIQIAYLSISRNHGGIIDTTDGYEYYDLNSKNGTMVSGTKIDRIKLEPNLVLDFGSSISLTVNNIIEFNEQDQPHKALLVFTGEDNVGACTVERELLATGLSEHRRYSVESMLFPSKSAFISKLEDIARTHISEENFYLHIKGHGSSYGVSFSDGEVLRPQELYSLLENIRSKKGVVIDTCLSGTFARDEYMYLIPKDTCIITSTNHRKLASEQLFPQYGQVPISRFTAALVTYLKRPEKISLKQFMLSLSKEDRDEFQLFEQKPRQRGELSYSMSCHLRRE
jgi:pSer/pThr/pTyr-binding forkhead associated (FHA) protein